MTAAILATTLLLAADPGPDADALVARLGADRYADREHAATALQTLGPDALPALRDALSAADAEVRSRAEALLDRIEAEMLTRPTPVRLDARNRPLRDVVTDLAGRLDFQAELAEGAADGRPVGDGAAPSGREPLPFWEAIDRLGLGGEWKSSASPPFGPSRPPTLQLAARSRRDASPSEDSGPFHVELRGPARPGPGVLMIAVEVQAEPHRLLRLNGPLRLTEAVTDRGRSLLRDDAEPDAIPRLGRPGTAATPGRPSPRVVAQDRLRTPDESSHRLRRLKGFVPVVVMARRVVPTTLPLTPAGRAPGRSFSTEDYQFVILSVRDDPDKQSATLDFSFQPRNPALEPVLMMPRRRGFRGDFPGGPGLDLFGDQVEILDDEGRPLREVVSFRRGLDINGGRLTLTLKYGDDPGVGPPAQLRVHDYVKADADVAFEFRDVPLP